MKASTGAIGKSFQDRQLAAEVRNLTLVEIKKVLTGESYQEDKDFRKALLLKLSGTILPRLNEVSGADGAPISVEVVFEE